MSFWNDKFETMNLEEMREFQGAKLVETVKWLYDRIDFYKNAIDDKGITPDDIKSIDDISKLPFTVKTDLRDNYPFGLCIGPLIGALGGFGITTVGAKLYGRVSGSPRNRFWKGL